MTLMRVATPSLLLATSLACPPGETQADTALSLFSSATGTVPLCEQGDRTTIVLSRASLIDNFEVSEDPRDPQYLLVATNDGPEILEGWPPLYIPRETPTGEPVYSNVLVGRFNAVDGSFADGPVTVASNYQGAGFVNGPEFTQSDGRFGLLFAGPDGVHSVWRELEGAWHAFSENEDGSLVVTDQEGRLMAAPITVTAPGRFPAGGTAFEHRGHVEFFGLTLEDGCQEKCYGLLEATSGTTTDVFRRAVTQGFDRYFYSTPLPHDPVGVVFSGCLTADDASCGLFRAQIDGFGGLSPAQQIAQGGPYYLQETVIADALPTAGGGQRLVILAAAPPRPPDMIPVIDVWTCDDHDPFDCQAMTLQARVETSRGMNHFRTVTSSNAVYLHYLIREDWPEAAKGSYLLEVRDGGDGTVSVAGPVHALSKAGGVEVVWASFDASLRLFFLTPDGQFAMCRLVPGG
ncbi:MAG: hypothetical protein U9Q81_03070 [Pseudomonadota bacterium]|nr:hypothetical protein [Pseudomonadota bacterium]